VALLEKAAVFEANGDDSFTIGSAMDAVKEMENELAEHLIGMFHQRFSTKKKGLEGFQWEVEFGHEQQTTESYMDGIPARRSTHC
jgi:hypothetical protein